MKFEEIKELIDILSNSNLTNLEIKNNDFKIKLSKEAVVKEVKTPSFTDVSVTNTQSELQNEIVDSKPQKEDENITTVLSPIVGTYYASPSPEDAPFVSIGTKVAVGDTLCIIEAMKLMNDITSEVNGEVVEILVKNEDMVEYGQPIIKIKKN